MMNVLRNPLALGLALTLFGLSTTACDGGGDEMATTDETSDTDATTDETDSDATDSDTDATDTDATDTDATDTDATDTSGECVEQPPECAKFVECISALVPSQQPIVEEQYGVDGSCWCGTVDEINECFTTCLEQVNTALGTMNGQLEPACHPSSCDLEELDPTQPYGPIVDGACGTYEGPQGDQIEQTPFDAPFGVPGGFCAPTCSGLANFCPGHTQTTAEGTCYIGGDPDNFCALRCYVDPLVVGGTQCPCGARCQPQGGADGGGNLLGLCTFE